MFLVGFPGKEPTRELIALIERGITGVVLFARNVGTPQETAALCAELKRIARRPLLICVDQEGGRVARLRDGFTPIPSMRDLGRHDDESTAREIGRVLGRELRAVNIDMDLAPVLDVDSNPKNPVIADRSFGADAQRVARMGVALLQGLQSEHVAACGKHFPGHGDTWQDSHHDLPHLPYTIDDLERRELIPFRAAIAAGAASIMSSHIVFDAIDPIFPGTLSRTIVHGLLRERLGFDRVVKSDDLQMKAIANHFTLEQTVVSAVNATVDLLCISQSHDVQVESIRLLGEAIATGAVPIEIVEAAHARIARLVDQYAKPPTDVDLGVVGSELHRELAARVGATSKMPDPTEALQ